MLVGNKLFRFWFHDTDEGIFLKEEKSKVLQSFHHSYFFKSVQLVCLQLTCFSSLWRHSLNSVTRPKVLWPPFSCWDQGGPPIRSLSQCRTLLTTAAPSLPAQPSSQFWCIHAQLSHSLVVMHNNHQKEHLYKILVIGDLGVGKTSIIKRYVHHNFSPNYRATIGVDFALKVLNWDQETVRLQLWDIAGISTFLH